MFQFEFYLYKRQAPNNIALNANLASIGLRTKLSPLSINLRGGGGRARINTKIHFSFDSKAFDEWENVRRFRGGKMLQKRTNNYGSSSTSEVYK
jgi:hypothetical protein